MIIDTVYNKSNKKKRKHDGYNELYLTVKYKLSLFDFEQTTCLQANFSDAKLEFNLVVC